MERALSKGYTRGRPGAGGMRESLIRNLHLVVLWRLLFWTVIEGEGSVISRPLQATWPHKMYPGSKIVE